MAATAASTVLGSPAPKFRLPSTNGNTYALQDIAGSNGTVIVFICNHCLMSKPSSLGL
jgi:peroxiredoxin